MTINCNSFSVRTCVFAIALATAGIQTVYAQSFLKKLGNAVDKVLTATSKNSSSDKSERKLGKTVYIGDMSMEAYGDNPGIGMNFVSCVRDGQDVVLTFTLPNQGGRDVENVWLMNYGQRPVSAYGADGSQYQISYMTIGDRGSNEGISVNIPAGTEPSATIRIAGVPASAKKLKKVIIYSTGQYPMDAISHSYSFRLGNVEITDPTPATGATSLTMPAEGWTITKDGVGPVVLGASVAKLPAKIAGLYDGIQTDNENSYLSLGEENVMTLDIAEGKIKAIRVFGNNVGLKVGNKIFKVGGDSDALKAQPGVKGNSYDYNGEYQGVYFEGYEGSIDSFRIGNIY